MHRPFVSFLLLIYLFPQVAFSIPVRNLHDEKTFQYIRITQSEYFYKVPLKDAIETIHITQSKTKFQILVPSIILESWKQNKIHFEILPFPKRLIDIDPNLNNRIQKGCIPTKDMLNGYKDPTLNEVYLNCIQLEFPEFVSKKVLGKSYEGRDLIALRIQIPSSAKERTNVFIHCGIHGNEPIAIEHCYDILIQSLTNPQKIPELQNINLWVLPIANPDGVYRFWHVDLRLGRTNARMVDLNRNFPFKWNSGIPQASSAVFGNPYYRGEMPASEPEVQALLKLFQEEKFLFSLSIHCFANSLLVPYTIPNTQNPQPNLIEKIGKNILRNFDSYRMDKPFQMKKNLYPVDGTDQDTFFHHYGTYAYLLESSHLFEKYSYVPLVLEGLSPIWQNLIREASQHYKWRILVLNQENEPIPAYIESNSFQYFENEIRRATLQGHYEELATSLFPVQIQVSYPGYKTKKLQIYPAKNPDRYTIYLEKDL